MPSHRVPRIAEAIREVVASSILFEVSDPRVKGVTVLRAEVSPDLRTAVVYITLMGTEAQQKLAMKGIHHATGFLQAKVAARLQTRSTPVLSFKSDEGVKKSVEMSKLIEEALAADRRGREIEPATDASAAPTESDDDSEA